MPIDLIPLAILLAIAPGYVLIHFATLGRTGRALTPDLHLVLQSLVVSAAVLAAVGPFAFASLWPHRDHLSDYPWWIAFWLVGIVALVPYVVGRAVRGVSGVVQGHPNGWLTQLARIAVPASPPPTIWDWAVISEVMVDRFLIVEYRDGRRIAGAHGRPGVSLSSPESHGIYLAIEWTADEGGVVTQVNGTAGVLVPITEDVRCIHILTPGGKNHDDLPDQSGKAG